MTEISQLTDDELAAAFVRTYGVTDAKARQLVEIHRQRLKSDLVARPRGRVTIRDVTAKG